MLRDEKTGLARRIKLPGKAHIYTDEELDALVDFERLGSRIQPAQDDWEKKTKRGFGAILLAAAFWPNGKVLVQSNLRRTFTYDNDTAKYSKVNDDTDVLSFNDIRASLDTYLEAKEQEMVRLGFALQQKVISRAEFQAAAEQLTIDSHLIALALSKGGWANLSAEDYAVAGQLIKDELGGVAGTHTGFRGLLSFINSGGTLDGRFLNRLRLYAHAPRYLYQFVQRGAMLAAGYTEERSVKMDGDS